MIPYDFSPTECPKDFPCSTYVIQVLLPGSSQVQTYQGQQWKKKKKPKKSDFHKEVATRKQPGPD